MHVYKCHGYWSSVLFNKLAKFAANSNVIMIKGWKIFQTVIYQYRFDWNLKQKTNLDQILINNMETRVKDAVFKYMPLFKNEVQENIFKNRHQNSQFHGECRNEIAIFSPKTPYMRDGI